MSSVEVVVHPLVLLSVVDHYNRVAKDTRKRVVGVLLGSRTKTRADITNSFAVPFEEDLSNPRVWFLDHNFLETMYWMFKKVNTREEILGFYSSGPRIKENDLKINALFERFCANSPIFVIVDVRPNVVGIPTTAYQAVDEVQGEGKEMQRVFKHITCVIEAEEAEEVGVEHLLRDINDPTTSNLALQISQKKTGLDGLLGRLQEMRLYLEKVVAGKMPINNQISYNLQNILNLLPNLNVEELVKSMLVKTNDMHLVLYVSSLIRAIIALHDLLNNKLKYKDMDEILDKDANAEVTGAKKESTEIGSPKKSRDTSESASDPSSETKK